MYPKGDLRRMLVVLAAVDAGYSTAVEVHRLTGLPRKTVDDLLIQAHEQAGVSIAKLGSTYSIQDWGLVLNKVGAKEALQCALNAHMMTASTPLCRGKNMKAFDKVQADATIDQLSHALGVLTQGRSFGIRLVATPECIKGLMSSDHPDRDAVIANIAPVSRIDGVL